MFTTLKNQTLLTALSLLTYLFSAAWQFSHAEVTLEKQVKIADNGLHFDGVKVAAEAADNGTAEFDYHFGRNISAHGDSVKTYKHFVFMTWYRGDKFDRHVMLSRYNKITGVVATIEFPHRHTGYRGVETIGESHNTIGLSVSPINGTIHMVYDMHAYDDNNYFGRFKNDFFRYSYSIAGTAEVSDADFTLDKFVKDTSTVSQGDDDYKHLTMTGDLADKSNFARLTYPKFFVNTDGTLLLYMRLGGNNNGAYVFNRYDATKEKWSTFTKFNQKDQTTFGNAYNWGLYGNMKYVNGKLRVGFQQRSNDNDDKYLYQNGIYYAYSEHPDGLGDWFNHKGESITWPLVNSDEIKVFEPGTLVETTAKNQVYIVGGFDWTVTEKGDIHFIHQVKDTENNKTVYGHTYKPAGATEFTTTTDFVGASSIYTAGDNIYIVGLRSGKPYVEMAKGGTNNFERVYEAQEGSFDHGVVYIQEGKVYYYLMEKVLGADGNRNAISTSMPLYLQIIDLGLSGTSSASFANEEVEVIEGYDNISLTLDSQLASASLAINNVQLQVDEQLVSTLTSAPYRWTETTGALSDLAIGTHAVTAIVTLSNGQTLEASASITVLDPTPSVSFDQSNISLTEGYTSLSLTVDVTSPVARDIQNVTLYVNDAEVSQDTSAPFQWNQTSTQLQALKAGTYTIKAVATDVGGKTAEQTMTISVAAKPVVTVPQPDSGTSSSGGGTSTPVILMLLTLLTLSRKYIKK